MRIVVYCSSVDNLPEQWQQAAAEVGAWTASIGACLVYGGVHSGLMHIAAQAAKDGGGEVVGIVPARRLRHASPLNDIKVPTSDLNDRKGVMQMLGDAFIVLPGGYGTLDEFTTSFSYLNFTRQKRPIIIVNLDGIFDPIMSQFALMVERGLMQEHAMSLLTEVKTLEELQKRFRSLVKHLRDESIHTNRRRRYNIACRRQQSCQNRCPPRSLRNR